MARPYQPSLLRLLHGGTSLLVMMAWFSGLVVYSQYDGRWGRLPLVFKGDWIDIHGSLAVPLVPLALLFGLYAISLGRRRLNQPANAVALVALALAIATGKLMHEDWLREGQMQHLIYSLHLLGWVGISATVIWHLSSILKLGGLPLASSMISLSRHKGDQPRDWPSQIRRYFKTTFPRP